MAMNPGQVVLQPQTPSSPFATNAAAVARPYVMCGEREGWGPLSQLRFDLTPCFLDVSLAAVAGCGVLGGLAALHVLRRRIPQPVPKDWHFFAKLVGWSIFLGRWC